MVRLLGNVKSVSMLSLPLQLLRTAAAASPGGISRSSGPTARATTQGGHSLADRDLSWYEHWLENEESYSRQPHKQVETILRSGGRDRDADVIAMKSIDRQYLERKLIFKVAGEFHKWTVGYGYRPERIISWTLAFILIGGIVANWLPRL
jgi:hypothetical protein